MMRSRVNFDQVKFRSELDAAVRAGHTQHLLRYMRTKHGIAFDESLGEQVIVLPEAESMAFDAPQSELVTLGNSGIPSLFLTNVYPETINILVAPMMAAKIAGEVGRGSWDDDIVMFKTGEATGETSAYGDYSRSGSTDVNYNFPQRQNFRFQAFLQYGDLEIARAAKAKISLASDKQSANALALMKTLNRIYFLGVSTLQNFGLLNDPTLPPPIAPQFSWLTSSSATANTIYQDIVRMYTLLQQQSKGTVTTDTPMTLAMSNTNATQLNQVTLYNTNSVLMLLKQNYKNLRLETAPEYSTPSGELVQLIVDSVEGVQTTEAAFSVKMMAHNVVRDVSSVMQKRTSGGYGTIIKRPNLIAQMLG